MPNWVVSRLSVSGKDAENVLKNYFKTNENNEIDFDFNKILPMPDELNIVSGSITDDCIKVYLSTLPYNEMLYNVKLIYNAELFHFSKNFGEVLSEETVSKIIKDCISLYDGSRINSDNEPVLKTKEDVIAYGKRAIDNIKKYGSKDWYDWSVKNWGTKWNACNTTYNENHPNEIYFDTAWSDVRVLIKELSTKHPKNTFKYDFAEEQMGHYTGTYTVRNGQEIENIDYADGTLEAFEMSFDLWGEDENYVFNEKTGTYEYVDEDDDMGDSEGEM